MKKWITTILTTIISYVLYCKNGLAENIAKQCMLEVPVYNRPLIFGDTKTIPVIINSDNVKVNLPDNVVFSGNVEINHGNNRLQADEIKLNKNKTKGKYSQVLTVNAFGNVHYDNNKIIIKGQKAWSNLNSKDINVWKSEYIMVGRQGHGKADLIKQRDKDRYTIIENGSFTSCLPSSNIWSVVGSKVIYDREKQLAKIWNARFKLGTVSIFYSPYLQFPIGNRRSSGLLTPKAKYSTNNYFELSLPYYWNIAPNIDATISPHYIHKQNDIIWENEFRYLTKSGSGLMELDYLPSDKINKKYKNRWLFYWQHTSVFDKKWNFNIFYTKISDLNYLNDFDSKYASSKNNNFAQKFSLTYAGKNFNATLSKKQFQVLDTNLINNYRVDPQFDINWYKNNIAIGNITFGTSIYGQAVHFRNKKFFMPQATRIYIEPKINLPLHNDWASIDTEAKLMATHYKQKNINLYNKYYNTDLAKIVNRVLLQFKIDSKFILERDINFAKGYTETLEPRMQYIYVPYSDHSKIKNYDSSLMHLDYNGLFRDRTYSGIDLISSANKLTTGITKRIYDNSAVERFNFSFGKTYYFSNSKTCMNDNSKINSFLLAGETYWRITNNLGMRCWLQYDNNLNNFATGSGLIEYINNENKLLQFNYRYASIKYLKDKLQNYNFFTKEGISQVGAVGTWPILNSWLIVGSYYYNTNTNKSADYMVSLQYNSCCYAISLGYERKINSWDIKNNNIKYNKVICFNVELRGLSSNNN